jgi:hypothetical protein
MTDRKRKSHPEGILLVLSGNRAGRCILRSSEKSVKKRLQQVTLPGAEPPDYRLESCISSMVFWILRVLIE